jgi:hypothetical protein
MARLKSKFKKNKFLKWGRKKFWIQIFQTMSQSLKTLWSASRTVIYSWETTLKWRRYPTRPVSTTSINLRSQNNLSMKNILTKLKKIFRNPKTMTNCKLNMLCPWIKCKFKKNNFCKIFFKKWRRMLNWISIRKLFNKWLSGRKKDNLLIFLIRNQWKLWRKKFWFRKIYCRRQKVGILWKLKWA